MSEPPKSKSEIRISKSEISSKPEIPILKTNPKSKRASVRAGGTVRPWVIAKTKAVRIEEGSEVIEVQQDMGVR